MDMAAPLLLAIAIVSPPQLPDELKSFDLGGSSIAKGFRAYSHAEVKRRRSNGSKSQARLFFRSGPSILDCHVMVFESEAKLREWDKMMSRGSATWFSPLKSKPQKGVHRGGLGGMMTEGLRMPEAAIVGRFVISVRPEQSIQYSRHHPEEYKFRLSNKRLNDLAVRAMDELIKRAQKAGKSKG